MSYCRFSSMNGRSDVYVYNHCDGGYVIHVANKRLLFQPIPDINSSRIYYILLKLIGVEYNGIFSQNRYKCKYSKKLADLLNKFTVFWHTHIHMKSHKLIPLIKIKNEQAGMTFCFDIPMECAEKLEELKSEGFIVPEYAIVALKDEANENANL